MWLSCLAALSLALRDGSLFPFSSIKITDRKTHLSQCPVLPVRINLSSWFSLTQTTSSTLL